MQTTTENLDIMCVGEMLIDFTPTGTNYTYRANPGGAPANVAVAAARAGVKTAFLGVLGNDDFGRRLLKALRENGVTPLKPELTDKAVTTLAFVTLDAGGDRSFTFARKPGADMLLAPADVRDEDLRRSTVVHAGSVSLFGSPCREATARALRRAHELGKIVTFDVNYRDMIWGDCPACMRAVETLYGYIDILKISREELDFVGGEEAIPEFMRRHNITVLVETLGGDGVQAFLRQRETITITHIPAAPVPVVDTTGAGDAFFGNFLALLVRQKIRTVVEITAEKLGLMLAFANAAAGICVQRPGGIPALPRFAEVAAQLEDKIDIKDL